MVLIFKNFQREDPDPLVVTKIDYQVIIKGSEAAASVG
jgi:hypothetical protein